MAMMAEMPQYHYIEGVENLEGYRPGGYHPVGPGEILKERYCIVDKLGSGGYATVWLARDTNEGRYVALKIAMADCGVSGRESKILQALTSTAGTAVPAIIDEFEVQGPNGTHFVYAMPPALCDLESGMGMGMFQLKIARAICGRLIAAVDMSHSQGYVHGDLRPSNVLVMPFPGFDELSIDQFHEKYGMPETIPIERFDGQPLSPHVPKEAVEALDMSMPAKEFELCDTAILLSDFGESFSPSAGESRLGQDSHTPGNVRPPECSLDPTSPMSTAADIWQLGLALWNVVALRPLTSTGFGSPAEIIKELIDMLGPLPPVWRDAWEDMLSKYFEKTGRRLDGVRMYWSSLEDAYEGCVEKHRARLQVGTLDDAERKAFLDLMRRMLAYLPEERPSAQEVLQSDWVVKWVKPDMEQSIQETWRLVVASAKECPDVTVATATELCDSDDSGICLSLDPSMTETSDLHKGSGASDSGVSV